MIEKTHTCIDPFGDPHLVVEQFFPYFPSSLEDHSRSYADKYYPIGRHLSYSAQTRIDEELKAATNLMAAVAFEKSQKEQIMTTEIEVMEQELEQCIRIRNASIGATEKRTNYRIAELQNRIDHAKKVI